MNVFSITAVKIGLKQNGEGKPNFEIENKCSFLYKRKMTFQKRYRVAKLAIGKNKDFSVFFCLQRIISLVKKRGNADVLNSFIYRTCLGEYCSTFLPCF